MLICAEEDGIKIDDYNLPNDFKELGKLTKIAKSEDLDSNSNDFKAFFQALKISNSATIRRLKFWIEHLKENPYNYDLDKLKAE